MLSSFFAKRRARKHFGAMVRLQDTFLGTVQGIAKERGCERDMNPLEVTVLGTFFISETFVVFAREAPARGILDEFHKYSAEQLFNLNLSSFQAKFPGESIEAIYDQFMRTFYEKVQVRYEEYRKVMLDDNGLFKQSEKPLFEVVAHLAACRT